MVCVNSYVPVMLDMTNSNFNKWVPFFQAMCGKFGLMSHIDDTPKPEPVDASLQQADCCVRSRLLGSGSNSVLHLAMEPLQTARDLWLPIKGLFQANKEACAVFLSLESHLMAQGDLAMFEYSQSMNTAFAFDALCDVGHPISESQLVLNLLLMVLKYQI